MNGAESCSPSPPLDAEGVRAALGTAEIWPPPEVAAVVDSTNDRLAGAARAGAPSWSLVVAEAQTAGRGRRGRTWESPAAGNLYLSLLTPVAGDPALAPQVPLVVAVAAAEVLAELGAPVEVKWPNDLVDPAGGKMGGILVEEVPAPEGRRLVVGIGINVAAAPPHAPGHLPPVALSQWLAGEVDRNRLAGAIAAGVRAAWGELAAAGFGPLRQRWEKRAIWLGETVRIRTEAGELRGRALGIDDWGRLRLATAAGGRLLSAGDVSMRPAEGD